MGVALQVALRELQRVAPEGLGQLLRIDHDLDDDRLAGRERVRIGVVEVRRIGYAYADSAHCLGDLGEVEATDAVADVDADVAVVVEVDLVLLLRAPLLVVEDAGDHRQLLLARGHHLVQAHAPGAVADDREHRPVRRRDLGAERRRIGKAAVTEAERR